MMGTLKDILRKSPIGRLRRSLLNWHHERKELRRLMTKVRGNNPMGSVIHDFVSDEERLTGRLSPQAINFFHTFGFLKIKGFFQPDIEQLQREFDVVMGRRYGVLERKHYFHPQFMDQSEYLVSLLESDKVNNLVDSLLGPDAIYKGSDGVRFLHGSPWHRDYFNRVKSIKVLTYLEENDENSGALRVIPGSHFTQDAFAKMLAHALTWPEPPVLGGFDEKKFFPSGNSPQELAENAWIPHVSIQSSPGDIVIFNHNVIHCANEPLLSKDRRLMAFAFAANLAAGAQKFEGAETMMQEMRDVSQLEVNSFSLPSFYGPAALKSASPRFQRRLDFLRDIKTQKEGTFAGRYHVNDEDSTRFGGRFNNQRIDEYYRLN